MNPPAAFSPRAVLGLVLFGALAFVVLLWSLGAGHASGNANNGDSHAGGRGLNGYAALAGWLEARGQAVRISRSPAALDDPALLVLTPPQHADGAELARIVEARRWIGPTLVILPKWVAVNVPASRAGGRKGWVELAGAAAPQWPGFLDDVAVGQGPVRGGWQGLDASGRLPRPDSVQSGRGASLVPLVVAGPDERILAAYVQDAGRYPALEEMATLVTVAPGADDGLHPVVLVFEPDLVNNMAFARPDAAALAEGLFSAAAASAPDRTIVFDLTQNGLARSANLLTLAFTPPYLAATLCLLIAALVVGWRAFARFGPPLAAGPAMAFGKGALVANAAGLIRRAGRLHMIAGPYADAARDRLAIALALPRGLDPARTEAAIDRALAARHGAAESWSAVAGRLRAARRAPDMLRAAQDLHALERKLTR